MNTTPTPDQTPERRDADCPICGKFARNWNSNNCKLSCSDTSCPGFKIDLHPNEWNHRPLEDALRARLAEAEKDAKADDNRLAAQSQRISDLIYMRDTLRATNATLFQRIAKLEEDRADLSKCVQWLIDNTSEEARRLFPGTIARLQKIASAVLPPTPGATNATLAERVRRLEEALTQIVNWGPFPDTGEFWPDATKVSYGSQYGTNGEICYMVNVAKAALSPTPGAAVGKEGE